MPISSFQQRLAAFGESNRQRLMMALQGKGGASPEILNHWEDALRSLVELYREAEDRLLLSKALADPYFPLSMLSRLNVEEFKAEPEFTGVAHNHLAGIVADHVLERAEVFLSIRQDLAIHNKCGRGPNLKLPGSPGGDLPHGNWCTYCGNCCAIRGGPPEFTGPFQPPERWSVYFRGDALKYQRFCPFLFEYFATAKFFCAIYTVKPKCCWAFGREECEFLQHDLAREQAARVKTGGA